MFGQVVGTEKGPLTSAIQLKMQLNDLYTPNKSLSTVYTVYLHRSKYNAEVLTGVLVFPSPPLR